MTKKVLIVQPESSFGSLICDELLSREAGHPQWQSFEFAVAWVNYNGAERIIEAARAFLAEGGRMYATVGLDFGSTTYEGLGSLLDLETAGAGITTHVFYDENRACTFHPKMFLFSNADRACLIVGSNNMTGAGLDANVEAALGISAALENQTIRRARETLAKWRDDPDARSRRLTRELLEELRNRRYVLTEEEVRRRSSSSNGSRSTEGEPLFGRSPTRTRMQGRGARARGATAANAAELAPGQVLLMRVRPRRNGSQLQISKKVLEASFMHGALEVVSVDGTRRRIGFNRARGARNTARFEAPEMMGMEVPVARFQWVNQARSGQGAEQVLQYEIFDANRSVEGAKILSKLAEGIARRPETNLEELSQGATVLSTRDRAHAQWYRLESS